MPRLKVSAQVRYRVSLRVLKQHFGGRSLRSIKAAVVWGFIDDRRRQGVTDGTIRRDLTCLSSILKRARQRGLMGHDPIRDAEISSVKPSRPRTAYLSHRDEMRLLDAAPRYQRPLIIFAIETGLRFSEQMLLRHDEVSIERREIFLTRTKTDEPRVVPLSNRAIDVLRAMPRHSTSPLIFCRPDGGPYQRLHKGLTAAASRAGLPHVRWHDFRRTCACRLLQEKGADIYRVKQWLGHASVTTTERSYAFLRTQDLHRLLEPATSGASHEPDRAADGDRHQLLP